MLLRQSANRQDDKRLHSVQTVNRRSMNSSCRKRRLKAIAVAQEEDNENDPGATTQEQHAADVPTRDCRNLFAVSDTLCCAWKHGCVPCAYKIGTFDVALDYVFGKRVPNQRPELCPRATAAAAAAAAQAETKKNPRTNGKNTAPSPEGSVLGYRPGMKVLTVGDGDFSFSLALARFGCRVTATSYETRETVLRVYKPVGVEATLSELERHQQSSRVGSSCCLTTAFTVDATNLRETLPTAAQTELFDRVVWNFPCSAVGKGQDAQNLEMDANKELVRRFVDNARSFLTAKGGQIHINHKTKPPFNQWKLEQVALSAAPNHVCYLGRVVLDRFLFPPYVPRKALDRKSFPCHDACTYIFALRDDGNDDEQSYNNNPLLSVAIADPFDLLLQLDQNDPVDLSKKLVAVTPGLINDLRRRLLLVAEQTSVNRGRKGKKRKKRR